MKSIYLVRAGRVAYAIALIVFGIHQIYYGDFRTVILPPWPIGRVENPDVFAYLTGAGLVLIGILIIFTKFARPIAFAVGAILLALAILWHLPFILFIQPHEIRHFGIWAEASKCLALAGGAFVLAGTFRGNDRSSVKNSRSNYQPRLLYFGSVLFAIVMIEFGIDHFLYSTSIATLVPTWIPGQLFWTYLAGAALIASGASIILTIKHKLAGALLSAIIFIWFLVLHIPRALAFPDLAKGNEVVSAADALAFSGTALLIACFANSKKNEIV